VRDPALSIPTPAVRRTDEFHVAASSEQIDRRTPSLPEVNPCRRRS
jgi:hypothetical protein